MNKIGAVMVAAGKSSRMGSFKPLLPLNDSTIIEHGIKTLLQCGVSNFVVVTGRESARLQDYLSAYGISFTENSEYERTDMFFSAKLGLASIFNSVDAIFFTPADIPLFKTETVYQIIEHTVKISADIVIPAHSGEKGHPILLRSKIIPELLAYTGADGLRGAISACGATVSVVNVDDVGVLLDADTPEDYAKICAIISTRSN